MGSSLQDGIIAENEATLLHGILVAFEIKNKK